ncbi:MAG: hypothetical protein ACLFR8_09145 [Alkalispirochaeta sp.]
MKTGIRIVSIVLLCLAGYGCTNDLVDTDTYDATPPPEAAPKRWRILYYGWDENELARYIAEDIAEIASIGFSDTEYHCIVVRASKLRNGEVEVIQDGVVTTSPIDAATGVDPNRSLYTASDVAGLRGWIVQQFPAERELVILAGHGRGWRGIGSVVGEETTFLVAGDIPALLHDPAATIGSAVVVFDVGYTPAELLVELPVSVGSLVATNGPRHASGLDFAEVEANDVAASTTELFLRTAGNDGYVLTGDQIASLPETIASVGVALSGAITSRSVQDSLQNTLLTECRVPSLPGDAYVTLDEVCSSITFTLPGIPSAVPLCLVHLDELGLPDGHDPDYRRDSDETTLSPGFREIPWSPDLLRREGALFDLWYREF